MNLSEANFRVALRTHDGQLPQAIDAAPNLILFGGTGAGVAPPGGPLPEIDTWRIYAKAESPDEAQQMVEQAVAKLEKVAVVIGVQPFSVE